MQQQRVFSESYRLEQCFNPMTRRIGQAAAKWQELEKDPRWRDDPTAFPLSVADMDFWIAPTIRDGLIEQAQSGIYGYHRQRESYTQAVTGWMKRRHDFAVDPEWLVRVPGVVYSLYPVIEALTDPGDGVIIQTPVYQPFRTAIQRTGRTVVENPLQTSDGRYTINFADLEQKAADPRCKLLIFCSPHNPVGRVWHEAELRELARICIRHDLMVLSDEIHHDLVYAPNRHHVLLRACPELAERAIIATSPGKTFNLAGLGIANLIIMDALLRRRVEQAIQQSGAGGSSTVAALACEIAYTSADEWYEALIHRLTANRQQLGDALERLAAPVRCLLPEGSYLAWLDFSGWPLTEAERQSKLKKEAGLFMSPGSWFGDHGRPFERLNFALPEAALTAALQRLTVLASAIS